MVESQALRNACEECHGEGVLPSNVVLVWNTCPHCDGTGYEQEEDKE